METYDKLTREAAQAMLQTLQNEMIALAQKKQFDCYDATRIGLTARMYTDYAVITGLAGDWCHSRSIKPPADSHGTH